MYRLVRTDEEIDNVMNKALDASVEGSKWPGMSYEEGIDAAIRWIVGLADEDPMED